MICKWCAATVENGKTVCRRCGKEQPALSDCGGFYDLVPSAQRPVPTARGASRTSAPRKKRSGAMGLVCVLLVAALVVAGAMNVSLAERSRELERELDEAREQERGSQLSTEPESTEPERKALKQQDVQVALGLEGHKGSYSMKVAPSHPAQVTVKCTPKSITGIINGYSAEVDLADGEETARAELTLGTGADGLTLECTLAHALGDAEKGFVLGDLTYTDEDGAQCSLIPEEKPAEDAREDESTQDTQEEDPTEETAEEPTEDSGDAQSTENTGEQTDPGEDEQTSQPVSVTRKGDTTQIVLNYDCLRGWMEEAQLDADTQLTCSFIRSNDQGGTFTVVVEGITVPEA